VYVDPILPDSEPPDPSWLTASAYDLAFRDVGLFSRCGQFVAIGSITYARHAPISDEGDAP
jgi:hypothetical protein